MVKIKRQLGGRKETLLASVVNSEIVDQEPYKRNLTPADEEYQRYNELLKGFFEKFIRWQEILKAKEGQENEKIRGFSVFRSANSLSIKFDTSMEKNDPSNKILQMTFDTTLNLPEYGVFGEKFTIRPGPAGKSLLVDLDNVPLEKVIIEVKSQRSIASQGLGIQVSLPPDAPGKRNNYRRADYDLRGDTLQVSHKYFWQGVMTDTYATHLIDTLDALIPGTTQATPRLERRARKEPGTPKKPAASGRKPQR